MKHVSKRCRWRTLDIRLLLVGTTCCIMVCPMLTLAILVALLVVPTIFDARFSRKVEFFVRMHASIFATAPLFAGRKHSDSVSPDAIARYVSLHPSLRQSLENVHWLLDPLNAGILVKHPVLNVLVLFVLLSVLPATELCTILYSRRFAGLSVAMVATLSTSVTYYLYKCHYQWFSFLLKLAVALFVLITVPAVSFLIWTYSKRVVALIEDRRLLQEIMQGRAISRHVVDADFCKLQSNMFRCRYVSWLRDQKPPTDEWPDERPNVHDDESSSLLAQMDEMWLGLTS